jgi:hypothetical protein
MADRAHQPDQRAIAEHRRHDRNVEQVTSTKPGIVGYKDVAWPQRLRWVGREQRLDRTR